MTVEIQKRIRRYSVRSRVWAVTGILLSMTVLAGITLGAVSGREDVVVRVNGEPVTAGEFRLFMGPCAAETLSYFEKVYGVGQSTDFWTRTFGEERPVEDLRERTLKVVVRQKLRQILYREHGLMPDIRYSAFLDSLKNENKERKVRLQKGQVIYGPQQFEAFEYSRYLTGNHDISLKKILETSRLAVSEEALQQRYQRDLDTQFRKPDIRQIQLFTLQWKKDALLVEKTQAKALLDQIRAAHRTGEDASGWIARFNGQSGTDAKLLQITVDEHMMRNGEDQYGSDWNMMLELKQGQVSDLMEDAGGCRLAVCTSRVPGGYMPFSEVRERIRTALTDENYEALLDAMVRDAHVEKMETAFEALTFP